MGVADEPSVSGYLLIKLASVCNLACSYCYWFRDITVERFPALLGVDVECALLSKLENHIRHHGVDNFRCIFHGGEPTLFGLARFEALCAKLRALGRRTGCEIELSMTTNGVLVTREWAQALAHFDVHVAVSIDGPASVHDRRRFTHSGRGSHAATVSGYQRLVESGVEPTIIAVCDPASDPVETLRFFVVELGCRRFDVLPPDLNHDDDGVPSIGGYYVALFDEWYDRHMDRGVRVRFLNSLVRAVLGLDTGSDSFGFGPLHTVSLSADGTLEPNDVLRIGGAACTASSTNIITNEIDDVRKQASWQLAYRSSLSLSETCMRCENRIACGGGHLSHRFSSKNGFDNPSVYCLDLRMLFKHVRQRVAADLVCARDGEYYAVNGIRLSDRFVSMH